MKTTRYLFAMLLMALFTVSTEAQQRNILQLPDVTTQIGSAQLTVNINNTDEIVGAQFDLTLPEGMTASDAAVMANRGDGHTVTVSPLGNGDYRVLLYSAQNRPLRGQTGVVMYLPITIPQTFEEGSEHNFSVSNAVLAKASGENVITRTTVGRIRISKLPDLTVGNITCDKAEVTPGDRIVASWQVENAGEMSTGGGWSEQISLVSEDGSQSKLIATTHYDEALGASGIVSRQAEISLPQLLGIDGEMSLQVRIVPDSDTGEPASAQGNNTKTGASTITVGKTLILELSPTRVDENAGTRVAMKISRSGQWTASESFVVAATADSRVKSPSSVTIPANQSGAIVYLTVADNDVLDNDSVVSISVSGNGYPEASASFIIDDDELPVLTVAASKSEVSEGETFRLTITASRASAYPVTVRLSCDNASRFSLPQQVVIPAGETSAEVDVVAIDNDDIDMQESLAFKATAARFEPGECIVVINDNDMPTLSFTLSPENVGEADGTAALFGVIKRTDNLDKRVTLKLSDDSNGLLSYSSQTVVMEKGKENVQFNIGVVDNAMVDGNHTVTVTAAVYAASCDCSVTGDSKGSLTATVTVIDDDGPTLKIKSQGTSMKEGSEDNVFTISHNVRSDKDVTVTISSDKDDMLDYDHELTIPAGQTMATLLVNVKGNSQQDDDNIATFKVEADGYAMGTCWLMITDQTLPDAIVSLYADKTETEAGQTVGLKAVVKNVGNSALRSTMPIEIAFSGRSETVSLTIGKSLEVGDSAVVEYNYDLPAITGQYTFEATVNAAGKVPELIYANNSSAKVTITLLPPFTATAKADKDVYRQGEGIVISGTVTGNAGKNASVEVYIINDGTRQTVNATSDSEGNYTVTWQPLSRQSGHFVVGACYPGANVKDEMDAFDVYGLSTVGSFSTCELGNTETMSGKIKVANPGLLAQTGLAVMPKAVSANCEFSYDVPASVKAGESVEIGFTVKANNVSEGSDWQQMPIEITTTEGASIGYTLYYYVSPLKAKLEANRTVINTTMTYGTPREYPVTVRNIGKGSSGKITLAVPEWVQTVTPREMASLAQGDSATIMLRFMPTDNMKLNVAVNGRIGINCENGDGTYVAFTVTPVSEEKGTLKVDVVDEFTFYTDEAPHVSKAKVLVKNPSTKEIVAEGETADDGTFATELVEGYYSVTVEADKHDSHTCTMIVDPGVKKEVEVFVSYQAITYSWDVEETEVEDEYEIETIVKYETNVPKPVVVVTLPDEEPEPNSVFPIIITNRGLINAVDVNMNLSVSDGYKLKILNDSALDVLASQQSHVFYARIVPDDGEGTNAKALRAGGITTKCMTIIAKAKYKELCKKYTGDQLAMAIKKWGTRACLSSGGSSFTAGGSGGNGGGPGYPSSYGGGNHYESDEYLTIWDTDDPEKFCDQVLNEDEPGIPDPNDEVPVNDDETDDCDESPNFVFKLTSASNRKERKGVAADGLSQVRIVLGPGAKKPKADCGYTYKWTLSEDMGELSNDESLENVVYTAPENFPVVNSNKYTVKATLHYTKDNVTQQAEPVEIEVIRVPLALIHGLNSDDGCWKKYYNHLLDLGLYEDWQIENVDYRATHNSHFSVNYRCATNAIRKLKYQSLASSRGYEVTQVDLVGHSMGGILSRFHVQRSGKKNGHSDVHKLITVNTPHSGSEFGDIVSIDPILANAANTFGNFNPLDAIRDLAVNSTAIDKDLNGSTRSRGIGVPVHAITTTSPYSYLVAPIYKLSSFNTCMAILLKLTTMYNHSYEYALYLRNSDLIVSRESQEGGCEAISHIDGPWHCESPESSEVWSRLTALLGGSTESFSKNWFSPANRTFVPILDLNLAKAQAPRKLSSEGHVDINATVAKDSLFVTIDNDGKFAEHLVVASFGDEDLQASDTTSLRCPIPTTFSGDVRIVAICKTNNDEICMDSTFVNIANAKAQLVSISKDLVCITQGDTAALYVDALWNDGSTTHVIPETVEVSNGYAKYSDGKIVGLKFGIDTISVGYKGLTCSSQLVVCKDSDTDSDDEETSPSICSTVTLSFKQKNVMTRQAFRGTLTVNNGNEETAMTDVKLNLEVRDTNGNLTTSHEFQIDAESLKGFTGNLGLTSGWKLGAGETGTATVLFIPTKYAAPTESRTYSFGGSFSYTDPYTGLNVTRDLNPVTLTVDPSPNIEMTYFMQRDVFGDDPFTETVEPSQPAEFALLVNNKGYGDATNMSLTTKQPEIIDNEKGLAVTFELLSSQLNGGENTLTLGGNMTSDFGSIPAHSQAYAQWWLKSSLLGHFIEYDVKATHLTSHDNPDLSVIDTATIHELIHGFTVSTDGDKPLRGFLVNDIKDKDDQPDMVYFTDATQQKVYQAATASVTRRSDTEFELVISAGNAGWNYGSLLDPTYGKQKLVKVVRADGTEVNTDNVWQTDRTLRDGKDPLYENRLHFVGNMSSGGEIFSLTFEPKPDVELEVEGYDGLPNDSTVLKEQLTQLTVRFNKPVKAETFTTEDISLSCQGKMLDASQIIVTKVNEREYVLSLSKVTLADGYYVLTVQTSDIEDYEGFAGSTGKTASWTQFTDGKVALKLTASPVNGGTLTPSSGRFDYGSDVTVKATPAEGYDFVAWTHDGNTVSTESEYTCHVADSTSLKALFTVKQYNVTVDCDTTMGTVEGAASGIYDYGTQLHLSAVPTANYEFDAWVIDGERGLETASHTITVNGDMSIKALFKEVVPTNIETIESDAIRVRITPIPLREVMYISGNFNEIRKVNVYDMSGAKCLTVQGFTISGSNTQTAYAVHIGNLGAGIYNIQIFTDKGVCGVKAFKH